MSSSLPLTAMTIIPPRYLLQILCKLWSLVFVSSSSEGQSGKLIHILLKNDFFAAVEDNTRTRRVCRRGDMTENVVTH